MLNLAQSQSQQTSIVLQFIDLCYCYWQSMVQMVTWYSIKLVFFVQKITFVLRKINKNCCRQSPLFDSNILQIVCRLGLRLRPHWRSLQCSPDPLILKGGEERRGDGSRGEVEERGEEGREKEERGGKGGSSSFALGRKKKSRRL